MAGGPRRRAVAQVFLESIKAKTILGAPTTRDAIAIQYCEGKHWRFLALVGAEKTLYYWNPYGDELEEEHALRTVMARQPGWSVVSIPHKLPWTSCLPHTSRPASLAALSIRSPTTTSCARWTSSWEAV